MGTRKAPTGAKHAACRHHEAYASAPAGWLCFAQALAPTDDDILERMVWADDLDASRTAYRAARAAFQAANEPDGLYALADGYRQSPADYAAMRAAAAEAIAAEALAMRRQLYTVNGPDVEWDGEEVAA